MSTWTPDELTTMGQADELQIAPVRHDGSLRRPTTIWVVPHADDLYVRSVYGTGSAWYRATRARHQGHVRAGGVDKEVTLTDIPIDDEINEQLDVAYRRKYRRYDATYVDMMLTPQARAATIKLTPR
jgi:hypothetical protein